MVIAVTAWETVIRLPTNILSGVLVGIHFVCLLLIVRFPVPASVVLGIAGFVMSVMDTMYGGPSQLWGQLLALGVLGLDASIPVALAMLGTAVLGQAIQTFLRHSENVTAASFPFFVLMFTTAVVSGYAVRQGQQRRLVESQAHESAIRAEALRQRLTIATRIHDTVSNNLSVMAREAQRQSRLSGDAAQKAAWNSMGSQALATLDITHELIDEIVKGESEHVSDEGCGFQQRLEQSVHQADNRLAAQGFIGQTRLAGEIGDCADGVSDAVLSLLHELYANIDKHCEPGKSHYAIDINCSDTGIELTESCQGRFRHDSVPSGRGLESHKAVIESLGGTMGYELTESQWSCRCMIPIRAAS